MKTTNENTFTLHAPAKVNLCLAVHYPPVEGYHQLESVFQELDLHDTLTFEVRSLDDFIDNPKTACTSAGSAVCLECGPINLPTADNLIFKAIDAMEHAFGAPIVDELSALSITVNKQIPAGGGLGGGSSDAAAAIKAYARLAGVDATDERALTVARSLGADVAFFLQGGAALMDGRGDTLVRPLPSFPLPLLLMGEHEGISTARIYHDFDAAPPAAPDAEALAQAMEAFPTLPSLDDKLALAQACSNNLEPAAFAALPRLQKRVETARRDPDVLHALVTGSGATSYCICADLGAAMRAEQRLAHLCDWTAIC